MQRLGPEPERATALSEAGSAQGREPKWELGSAHKTGAKWGLGSAQAKLSLKISSGFPTVLVREARSECRLGPHWEGWYWEGWYWGGLTG